jgi:chaperone required for assembly of F1-ATPase
MGAKKRFYKDVTIGDAGDTKSAYGISVQLDGRDLRSPAGSLLLVPTLPLAGAIADEWRGQGDDIEPSTMPLFSLAVTVLDRVTPQREAIITELAAYGANDLLCYRDDQDDLASRQHRQWQPWLDRLGDERAIHLETVNGIMPVTQADAVKFPPLIAVFDDWRLGILHRATSLSGSLVLGLGFVEGVIDPVQMFELAFLDELWQNEKWGTDFEAADRHRFLQAELADAARFLGLLTPPDAGGKGA